MTGELARTVWFVVPDGIDDPTRPSGGNVYDARVRDGLRHLGWDVVEVVCAGTWPRPLRADVAAVAQQLSALPDDAVVLVDGLIGSAAADALVVHAARLRLVLLLHMPLGSSDEQRVLDASRATITTSHWTRRWLLERYAPSEYRLHVATPGVEVADPAAGTDAGGELVCVAAVVQGKGHDVLLDALSRIRDLPWRLALVGPLDRDPAFVEKVRRDMETSGIATRVRWAGTCSQEEVNKAYAEADLLVLASRSETYGMVVTEALAHGLPVVAGAVGGLPEALGRTDDGRTPGLLVPGEDPDALSLALRRWLVDPLLRTRLRRAAASRRLTLTGWRSTTSRISSILEEVAR